VTVAARAVGRPIHARRADAHAGGSRRGRERWRRDASHARLTRLLLDIPAWSGDVPPRRPSRAAPIARNPPMNERQASSHNAGHRRPARDPARARGPVPGLARRAGLPHLPVPQPSFGGEPLRPTGKAKVDKITPRTSPDPGRARTAGTRAAGDRAEGRGRGAPRLRRQVQPRRVQRELRGFAHPLPCHGGIYDCWAGTSRGRPPAATALRVVVENGELYVSRADAEAGS
jgi:hypothetical protein